MSDPIYWCNCCAVRTVEAQGDSCWHCQERSARTYTTCGTDVARVNRAIDEVLLADSPKLGDVVADGYRLRLNTRAKCPCCGQEGYSAGEAAGGRRQSYWCNTDACPVRSFYGGAS